MSFGRRIQRGLAWGTSIGALYFVGNLLGTFLAVGALFDPTFDAAVLLAIAGGMAITMAAALGLALSLVSPSAWSWRVRRRPRAILATLFLLTVAAAGYGFRVQRNHPPPAAHHGEASPTAAPVLWVVVDTLRADVFYGPSLNFPLAPNARRFAESATIFSDAETTAGWTIPSMAALLTGIHNTTTDASAGRLPDWAPTIAERLWAAGYETRAVVDNTLLEHRNGFAAGFETFFQRSGYRFAFSLPSFRILPDSVHEALRWAFRTSYYGSTGTTNEALRVIEQPHSRPLFLLVHYMDPHAPYHPHPETSPDPPGCAPINFWRTRDRLRVDQSHLPTTGQMKLLRHRYAGEIRALDADLGRLFRAWDHQFGNQGLVMITADHGEEFLEHGHLSHSMTVQRESVHVPLILRPPNNGAAPEPGVIDVPVSLLDVVPTTLDILGLPPAAPAAQAPLQGQSWWPWLTGQSPPPDRPLLASHSRHGRRTYRFRRGQWVYIKTMFYDRRPTVRTLFDLSADPTEQTDVLPLHPDLFGGISEQFEKLATSYLDAFDPSRPSQSEATEESLRALGYVQ